VSKHTHAITHIITQLNRHSQDHVTQLNVNSWSTETKYQRISGMEWICL